MQGLAVVVSLNENCETTEEEVKCFKHMDKEKNMASPFFFRQKFAIENFFISPIKKSNIRL